MNLKIDFDSSLNDFEDNSQAAYATLDDKSNNIVPIIYSGLKLTSCLSFDFDIDSYCELHSICLIYFGNLRKALSDKSRFTKDKLNIAFEISLTCPYVLPRLYLALLIACTTKNKEQLKLISEMLLAVAHPLRGLLLRFTAISFFPKCPELSDLLVDFAVTNFKEMLFLLSGFLKIYPKSKQLACQWLTSNTTISLFLSDNNPNIVKSFFDFAKACKENYVSIAIVDSISQSIEGPQIPKYFDLFADFFKTKAREETAKIKRNKLLQAKNRGPITSSKSNTQPKAPSQNQSKNTKPSTEASSLQNTPTTTSNPNPTLMNQTIKNSNTSQPKPQSQQQQPKPKPNPNPSTEHLPQQTQKQQPQLNRVQPSAVAMLTMRAMTSVALPPMRPMTSVAMPPIALPQQQQQTQQPDNQSQLQEQDHAQAHSDDETKKNDKTTTNELENENIHDSADNVDDDSSSESSNEEDINEEDENEDQNQQNTETTKSDDPNQNDNKSTNQDEIPDQKPSAENKIKITQSLSDSSLIPESKAPTATAVAAPAPTPQDASSSTTTSTQNNPNSNVQIHLSSSLSSPSLLSNQPLQQPTQPKKQKQRRRQQHANTLYNATKHIAIACLEKCDNAREGFRFIQMTPFAESCGLEVTRLALRMNDLEVVKMCASRWMKHSVLHEILTNLGYKAFAEIVPTDLPGGLEITKEFIQKMIEKSEGDSSDSVALRKILSGELRFRSVELNGYINELIITHSNFDEHFYRTLFADPYHFNDFLQISTVVSRYSSSFIPSASNDEEKESMKRTVLGFLDRTKIDIQNLISLRCGIFENGEKADELVQKSLNSIQDSITNYIEYNTTTTAFNNNTNLNANNSSNEVSFDSNLSLLNDKTTSSSLAVIHSNDKIEEKASAARRVLISHLSRLLISNSSLELLFNECVNFTSGKGFMPKSNENNEFTGFIMLSAIKGNETLTEKALIAMLNMDINTTKVSDQIHLYFEALNIIISVTDNEKENSCLISKDTTKRILLQIIDTIKALESYKKFFPIMTPVQSDYLLKIANAAKQKKYFTEFEDLFNSVIESLKNC